MTLQTFNKQKHYHPQYLLLTLVKRQETMTSKTTVSYTLYNLSSESFFFFFYVQSSPPILPQNVDATNILLPCAEATADMVLGDDVKAAFHLCLRWIRRETQPVKASMRRRQATVSL